MLPSEQMILDRFDSHLIDDAGVEVLQECRNRFKELTLFIVQNTKVGREQSITIAALEEAAMWASKAIATPYPVVPS